MRYQCQECEWVGQENQMLNTPNPFDPRFDIVGCPLCKEINTMSLLCDVDGCNRFQSCGFPFNGTYRMTCGDHYREMTRG